MSAIPDVTASTKGIGRAIRTILGEACFHHIFAPSIEEFDHRAAQVIMALQVENSTD